ncbi:MAG: succinylglutamate desuccinylase/aspartoacylase family protein [Pseudomonadota bacterium]
MPLARTFLLALSLFSALSMAAAQPFKLGDTVTQAGTSTTLSLDVPAGESDPATTIPLTVIHGRHSGPVLLIVAGVHGYEFASILAAQVFPTQIDPAALSGTVLLVNAAHVAAFEQRTPYVNPYDRKNLNRSFPGDPAGTQTDRVAWQLSELIARADFVIDVHSGDGAEWLDAFVGVYGGSLATGFEQALAVAQAFGFPNIVRYRMETQAQIDQGRSLNRQAVAAGLPTVLVEIGENGSREEAHVEAIVAGLRRTLGVLAMMPTSEPAEATPRLFDGTASVPVTHSGVWYPQVRRGRDIREGETLGVIRDYWGNVVEEVTAPSSGFALYGLAGPPVQAGESVMTIAKPATDLEPIK